MPTVPRPAGLASAARRGPQLQRPRGQSRDSGGPARGTCFCESFSKDETRRRPAPSTASPQSGAAVRSLVQGTLGSVLPLATACPSKRQHLWVG